jgi:hypothetical protein
MVPIALSTCRFTLKNPIGAVVETDVTTNVAFLDENPTRPRVTDGTTGTGVLNARKADSRNAAINSPITRTITRTTIRIGKPFSPGG